MTVHEFTAVIVRDGEIETRSDGETINILDEAPTIDSAVIGGTCESCGDTNLLLGDYQGNVSIDTPEGESPLHAIDFFAQCNNCGVDIQAQIEFAEFQQGVIQALQIEKRMNYDKYVELHGLKTAMSMV